MNDSWLSDEQVRRYVESMNLDAYDLGGVEITEEDYMRVRELLNEGYLLATAVDRVLCDIRDCLDAGLDDVGLDDDLDDNRMEVVDNVIDGARKVSDNLGRGLVGNANIDLEV